MKYILIITVLFFLALSQVGDLTTWEETALCLFVFFMADFLKNLGNRIVILDLTIIMALLTCLLMPVIFYHVYTKENFLARLWVKYMPIASDDYFSFAVPAVLALALGLKIPLGKSKFRKNPSLYLENVKTYLNTKPNLGLILIGVGVTSGLLDFLSPPGVKQIFYLTGHLTFVGVFYVIYSPGKNKKLIVPGVVLLMIGQSILTGMFGEFIFILACSLVLLLLGQKISLRRKLLFAIAGIALIFILQSIKKEYRKKSWTEGADPLYFTELITEKITNPSSIFEPNALFYTSVRMNQGWLVGETMKMVPERHPYGDGEIIWKSIAAAIVPRFLWPDKPETGGRENLKRFWGFDLVGWSTNIGTLGEAYANFGRTGGIIYMFLYGVFFNMVLLIILKLAEKRPTIILWLPYLFFTAIAVETDLLSTMGALVKGVFFSWIVFRVFHIFFRIEL